MASDGLILVGVNHKTTPIEIREKIALAEGYEQPLALLKRLPACRECYLLSTCNRVEVLVVGDKAAELERELIAFLFGTSISPEKYRQYVYVYSGQQAVHHLFAVAASLDSMIVGEAQILGQLKEAYRNAALHGCTGPLLNRLLHKSFSVAKRVRTETGIGSSAVSISYAAVELAKKIFGNLDDKHVLLIGAGEMAELAAEHLLSQKVASVVVANRTLARAVDLAKRYKGTAVALAEIVDQLARADIIISSTGATDIILHKEDVKPVMKIRRNRPLFFIDIAVPRDLDPALNELDNVYLYDIDDLSSVVEMNRSEREKEAVKAARIVDEETLKFQHWWDGMSLTPTILALRQKADDICRNELEKTLHKMPELSDSQRQALAKMVAAVSAKLLHDPLQYLKSEACGGRQSSEVKADIVRNVFGLHGHDKSD